jgi:hypothetical protein
MPLDAAPVVPSPLADDIAGQSALVLDMVEFYFQGGKRWVPGTWLHGEQRCLLGAVRFVRNQLADHKDNATDYLARAIRPELAFIARPDRHPASIVIAFNDAPRRTYAEVAAVVRKAKELAEADARAGDPDIAVDTDPIEARVIDEALKILGPSGEKWIKGREADKQHNHCIIGAIKLARRRLKVEEDGTKRLVLDEVYRNSGHYSIETFNDNPGRRFNSVREVMLLAKREAMCRVG